MSGQGGNRQVVADEMFPDGPGSFLDFADTDEGVGCLRENNSNCDFLYVHLYFSGILPFMFCYQSLL